MHGAEWNDPVEAKEKEILMLKRALFLMACRLEQECEDFAAETGGITGDIYPSAEEWIKFFIKRAKEDMKHTEVKLKIGRFLQWQV